MSQENLVRITQALTELIKTKEKPTDLDLLKLQRQYLKADTAKQPFFTKAEILEYVKKCHLTTTKCLKNGSEEIKQIQSSENEENRLYERLVEFLKVKPIRTQSGIASVTVLTKPWACPGKCIFCPADVRMPKSYLASEPGAQRAELNFFDPYLQVMNRLKTLAAMGHNLEKIELIILGGSWDSYPLPYQIWFMKRLFEALNDFGQQDQSQTVMTFYQEVNQQMAEQAELFLSNNPQENAVNWQSWQQKIDQGQLTYNQLIEQCYLKTNREKLLAQVEQATWEDLEKQQKRNETSKQRNVGLVIETRPDLITKTSLTKLRRLGCTKIQMGVQSVNDEVLRLNQRGTTRVQIAQSFALLRQFGYKIHVHFMANLYGSDVEQDIKDYQELVTLPEFLPDEIKLYPCSLLPSAPLMDYYKKGQWQPYNHEQLLRVLTENVKATPSYMRITRMIRDISATEIVVGNKKTNFRQLVEQELQRQSYQIQEIRSREIKGQKIELKDLNLQEIVYQTSISQEYFLQWVTDNNQIAGFLRLSLPNNSKTAMIREVHVYGVVSNLGEKGNSQHLGLGTKLVKRAEILAKTHDCEAMRVISAVGTRKYYEKLGFEREELYQIKWLK